MNSAPQLVGVWQATSAVIGGDSLPVAMVADIRLTLTDTQFTTRRGEEVLFDSTYTTNNDLDPMQMEMIGIGDFAGAPALGIYRLEADTLELCYRMPGFARPAEFASAPASASFYITLCRVQ